MKKSVNSPYQNYVSNQSESISDLRIRNVCNYYESSPEVVSVHQLRLNTSSADRIVIQVGSLELHSRLPFVLLHVWQTLRCSTAGGPCSCELQFNQVHQLEFNQCLLNWVQCAGLFRLVWCSLECGWNIMQLVPDLLKGVVAYFCIFLYLTLICSSQSILLKVSYSIGIVKYLCEKISLYNFI